MTGGLVGLVLVGLFSQAPELLVTATALLVGLKFLRRRPIKKLCLLWRTAGGIHGIAGCL